MASQDWVEKDFYAILGVPKDADAPRSRRPTASSRAQHHPDTQPRGRRRGEEVQGHRRGLRRALRPRAAPAVRRHPRDGAAAPGSPPARWRRRRGGFEDIFGGLFGGGGGGRASASTPAATAAPVRWQRRLRGPPRRRCSAVPRWRRPFGRGTPATSSRGRRKRARTPASTTLRSGSRRGHDRRPADRRRADASRRASRPASGTARRSGCAARASRASRRRTRATSWSPSRVKPHPVFGRDGDNLRIDRAGHLRRGGAGRHVEVPTLDGDTRQGAGPRRHAVGPDAARQGPWRPGTPRPPATCWSPSQVVVPQRAGQGPGGRQGLRAAEAGDDDPRADLVEQAKA